VLPTAEAWTRADARFALAFWPWALLAQPAPLPERLLAAVPDAVIDDALGGWVSPAGVFDDGARVAYVAALRDPDRLHAMCEEYRAAATLDRRTTRPTRREAGASPAPCSPSGARRVRSERGMRRRATADRPSNRSCHDPGSVGPRCSDASARREAPSIS